MNALSDSLQQLQAAIADRYRIERKLGAGGMAAVYLAEDLKHHRKVAIKVLRPELAVTLGPERFLREIETTANLRHPHILPLYDSGTFDMGGGRAEARPSPFYVMPYVEGESLRDRLNREKQLPLAEALQIAREVADALDYAHANGVVHRDIKPENILLERGHAVVADFGIARAVSVAGGERLTETGLAVGTPTYMSPEQASGAHEIDGRSDEYSLACVLYEMLAGQAPFTGRSVQAVVHQHLTAEAREVTEFRPTVPVAIVAALTQALAKLPADRYATLGKFGEALGSGAEPARTGTRKRIRYGIALAIGAAILLGGIGVLLRPAARHAIQLGRRTQATLDPGPELDPALSRDGKLLAYTGPRGAIMVRLVENGTPIPVVRGDDATGRWPAWLPEGDRLLFISARGIEIVSALGGAPRLLVADRGVGRGLAVAPDGKSFAYVTHDSLFTRALDGGTPRLVTTGRELHSFAWSPDGRWIAYVSGNFQYVTTSDLGNVAPSTIRLAPATGGPSVAVTDDRSLNVSPAWAGAHALLYLSSRDGGRDVYELQLDGSGRPVGAPARLTTGLNAYGIGVSGDGGRLAYSAFTETSNVWSLPIPRAGEVSLARAVPVTVGNQTLENFDISPDRQWVAFCSDRAGVTQLYRARIGAPGADPQQLTADTVASYWAAWSPDAREIAFHRFRGEKRMVFVMPAAGGAPVAVTDGRDDVRSPEWSPDGRRLMMLANWGTKPELQMVTRGADGRWSAPRPFPIVIGSDTAPAGLAVWSPDGRFLACGCGDGGIVIAPVDGGPARRLPSPFPTTGWLFPQWSADGRTIYHLVEEAGRTTAVVAVPVFGGAPRVVARFDDPARPWHRFGFRVRGDRMYFTLGDLESDIWVAQAAGK